MKKESAVRLPEKSYGRTTYEGYKDLMIYPPSALLEEEDEDYDNDNERT